MSFNDAIQYLLEKSLLVYLSLNDDPSYGLSQVVITFLPRSNTLQINVLFCISFTIHL